MITLNWLWCYCSIKKLWWKSGIFTSWIFCTAFLFPFTEVLDSETKYKIIPLGKVLRSEWFQKFKSLLRRGLKLPRRKKDILVCGLAKVGSVALAVGVSDMWHVTHETWHLICDFKLLYTFQNLKKFGRNHRARYIFVLLNLNIRFTSFDWHLKWWFWQLRNVNN